MSTLKTLNQWNGFPQMKKKIRHLKKKLFLVCQIDEVLKLLQLKHAKKMIFNNVDILNKSKFRKYSEMKILFYSAKNWARQFSSTFVFSRCISPSITTALMSLAFFTGYHSEAELVYILRNLQQDISVSERSTHHT